MTIQQQASEMVLGLPNSQATKVIEFVKMLNMEFRSKKTDISEVIGKNGGVSYTPTGKKLSYRQAGVFRDGFISISDDFDEPLPEMKEYM